MQHSTLTDEQQAKIDEWFETHNLCSGLGTREEACTVASYNLALYGKLTDEIPECMSPVIGRWIIRVQDKIPAEVRNSAEWKAAARLAPGTGRDKEIEKARLQYLLQWLREKVLPQLQDLADRKGFGTAWREMCEADQNTFKSKAYAARTAAAAAAAYAADAAARTAAYAAYAADAADAYAADADAAAADAAAYAAYAAYAVDAADAAAAAADAADAAAYAAYAAARTAADAAYAYAFWTNCDPAGTLLALMEITTTD